MALDRLMEKKPLAPDRAFANAIGQDIRAGIASTLRSPIALCAFVALLYLAGNVAWLKRHSPELIVNPGSAAAGIGEFVALHDLWGKDPVHAILEIVRPSGAKPEVQVPPPDYDGYGGYGFLYHLAPLALLLALGKNAWALVLPNLVYFFLMLYFTYRLGARLRSDRLGRLAVVLLALFPLTYEMSREYVMEFLFTACVPLALWLLLETEGFQRRTSSWLFGGLCALMTMIKDEHSLAAFMIGPVGYVLGSELLQNPSRRKTALANALGAVAAFLFIFVLRFGNRIPESYVFILGGCATYAILKKIWPDRAAYACVLLSLAGLTFSVMGDRYWNWNLLRLGTPVFVDHRPNLENFFEIMIFGFPNRLLSLPFFVLLALGIWRLALDTDRRLKMMLAASIMVPWLLIAASSLTKHTRYLAACLPTIAIVCSLAFEGIGEASRRRKAIGLAIFIGVLQYMDISFGGKSLTNRLRLPAPFEGTSSIDLSGPHAVMRPPFPGADLSIPEDVFAQASRIRPEGGKMLVVSDLDARNEVWTWFYKRTDLDIRTLVATKGNLVFEPTWQLPDFLPENDFLLVPADWDLKGDFFREYRKSGLEKARADPRWSRLTAPKIFTQADFEVWQDKCEREMQPFREVKIYKDEKFPVFSVRLYARTGGLSLTDLK